MFFLQDFEKPSPPQKPLPADPLGRSSRLGHSAATAGGHIPGKAALPIPIPTVPRPPPSIPLPSRSVQHDKKIHYLKALFRHLHLSVKLMAFFCHLVFRSLFKET